MHGAEHAGDELVDAVTLLHQRHESRYPALVVLATPEIGKDQLLECLDLVLQVHQVGNGLVTLIGVVDGFQTDVLLVLESAIELGVVAMEGEFGDEVIDVFRYQWSVSSHAITAHARETARKRLDPANVGLGLPEGDRVSFL